MGRKSKTTIKKDAEGKIKDQTVVIEDDGGEETDQEVGSGLFGDPMDEVSANLGKGSEPDIEFKLYQVEKGKVPTYLRDLTKTECTESFIQTNYPGGGDFIIRGRNKVTDEERVWNISIRGIGGVPAFSGFPVALGPGQDSTTAIVGLMIAQMNANSQSMIENMRLQQSSSDKKMETIMTTVTTLATAILPAILQRKDPDKELIDTLLKVMQASKGGDSEALGMILDFARSAASEVAKVINPGISTTDNPVVAALTTLGPTLQAILGGIFNRIGIVNTSPSGPPVAPVRPNGGLQSSHVHNSAVVPPASGAGPSASAGATTAKPQPQQLSFKQLFERFVLPEMTKAAKMSTWEQVAGEIRWLSYAPASFADSLKFNVLENYQLTEDKLKEEIVEVFPTFQHFSDQYASLFSAPDGEKLEQWFYDFYVELGGPAFIETGTTAEAVEGDDSIINS